MSQTVARGLKVIRCCGIPILEQLRLEEALLRNTQNNWLVINDGAATPAVVLGISGNPHKLVHLESAREAGVPLIKRFTGGGTVIVDKNTILVSMIMNQADVQDVDPFPRPIMQFTEQVYSDVFHTISSDPSRIAASTKKKHKLGAYKSNMSFQLIGNDYAMGDRKIGGNAQAILKSRWLHHTSFLWDFNYDRMALLKEPEKRPEYRGNRAHHSFITALSAFGFCRQEFTDTIEDAFACRGFDLEGCEGEDASSFMAGDYLKMNRVLDYDSILASDKPRKRALPDDCSAPVLKRSGNNMMELWRSEEMQLIQLIIPEDAAHATIAELGELGLLQFKDLNPGADAFKRKYTNEVKRCNEMARRLRFFHEQVTDADIPRQSAMIDNTNSPVQLEELESKLEEIEQDLVVINDNSERLKKNQAELSELQLVLEKAGAFFDDAREAMKATRLGFTAGTIEMENLNAFEKLLFRATRGNMYLRYSDVGTVTDPNSGKAKQKAVFVVFFAGERARLKVTKTCEAFSANRYPFPEDVGRQRQMRSDVTARLVDLSTTIEQGTRRRDSVLNDIARHLNSWITIVRREKAVYNTMNMLSVDVSAQALVGEAWAPIDAALSIQQSLQRATDVANASVGTVFQPLNTHAQPPTYYKTTMFSSCYQGIVESYGVARYREVNPTPFTLITFPFLFAVMFGDVGHAIMMVAFAAIMLFYEKKMLKSQMSDTVEMIFGGRYIILLMGLFSIFTGFMYNEFFSMPMAIAGDTQYRCKVTLDDGVPAMYENFRNKFCTGNNEASAYTTGLVKDPDLVGYAYPFGVDPIWHGTKTELSFLNSVKMKMSIVMGVVHMSVGIFMSLFNHLYFRDRLSLIYEFIPQVIFFWSIFGYLMFLIIFKWTAWPYLEDRSHVEGATVGRQPDIYGIMIDMFLKPGSVPDLGDPDVKYENNLYAGQGLLQIVLVLAALVCVPIMLLPKPLILKKRHEQRTLAGYSSVAGQDPNSGALEEPGHGGGHGHDGEEFNFGEIFVHQAIHTIEFVLGAVSNTASYLRLWALSLAHSQLSAVIYDKVLMLTVHSNSVWMLFIGVFVWLMATLLVLMCMESLSAFLHALRLHWVEFMNKFYHGDGVSFHPFAFSEIDKDDSFLGVD